MKKTTYLITTVIFMMIATVGYAQKWNQTKSLVEKWNQTKSMVKTTESKQMKISAENGERLDSVVTYNPEGQVTSRTEYVYNSAGKVIQVTLQDYNCESSGCVLWNGTKNKYEYDGAGNTTSTERYEYDSNTKEWKADEKETTTYDSKKRPLVSITYIWENSTWTKEEKTEFAYDDANRSVSMFGFSWDTLSSNWLATGRAVIKYDANYNLISVVSEDFENNTWTPAGKALFTYNSFNEMTSQEIYEWCSDESKWIGLMKFVDKYNAQGFCTGDEWHVWNEITNDWEFYMKSDWTLDNNGNAVEKLSSMWDAESQVWIDNEKTIQSFTANGELLNYESYSIYDDELFGNSKEVYERDKEGKVTSLTEYKWDYETNTFIPSQKTDSEYNKNGNLWKEKVYDYSTGGSWELASTTIYYYQPGSYSDVLSLSDAKITFYPNPTSEYFVIQGLEKETTISIFDISGKKVKEETAVSDKKINISTLAKGIYLVKINNKTAKLMIK